MKHFHLNTLSVMTATVIVLSSCQLLPVQQPDALVGDNWQLVWNDEFSAETIDLNKWGFETNCWGGGNNELQCYTDRSDNAFIRDGKLVIRAQKETFTGPADILPPDYDGSPVPTKTLPYTSARLRTLNKGDFKYGRIEVRAKLPGGQGIWPAIWMLPTDWVYGGWAASGEIDIMEAVNLTDDVPKQVHGTLHYGKEWPANSYSGASFDFVDSDPTTDFHTYAIEWADGEIRWYVDDVHYATQRETGWFSQAVNDEGELYNVPGSAPFDQRFHLLLNVAVGGNWPGNPDDSTEFPVEMEVDYVRVFECPGAQASLVGCATKNPRAERVFGNQPPEIIKVEFDPDFIKADVVNIFDNDDVSPFSLGQYVGNGSVDMSRIAVEGRGQVTRLAYNTDESVVYWQAPLGFDFSEFSRLEFDLQVLADPRSSGGLMMKIDCFHPCGTGDYPIVPPAPGEWTHYSIALQDLVKHPGSTLDLTNINTPLVIFPDWGNQKGVVLLVDDVKLVR